MCTKFLKHGSSTSLFIISYVSVFIFLLFMNSPLVIFHWSLCWSWVLCESNAKMFFSPWEKWLCRIKREGRGKGKESLQTMMQVWQLGKESGKGGGLDRKSFRLHYSSAMQPGRWGVPKQRWPTKVSCIKQKWWVLVPPLCWSLTGRSPGKQSLSKNSREDLRA